MRSFWVTSLALLGLATTAFLVLPMSGCGIIVLVAIAAVAWLILRKRR